MSLPGILTARAAEQPDRTALLTDAGRALTFREWEQRANAVAHGLLDGGLAAGDRVGLLFAGTEWIDFAVGCLAVLKAGGVAVPLPGRQSESSLEAMLGDCGARTVIRGAGALAVLRTAVTTPPAVSVRAADPAQILFTSGTTGRPKGVVASHANLAFGLRTKPRHRRLAHSEHSLHAFPIGTNAGQMMLVGTLADHPTTVVAARFHPDRFCALIATHRVGTVFLVPSMAIELLNSGACERHDTSSVLLLSSSADALPPPVSVALPRAFPQATIVNYYTSTEAVPAQTTMIVDPGRPDSVGRAVSAGELVIRDTGGTALPPGQAGEVWLRAPAAQRAYYGDPEASARVFRDGWTRMGDLGYLDADGYLYLVGRESGVIKSGGMKISAARIEAALIEHPAVAEAAVLPVPHPVLGSAVAAALVIRAEVSPGGLRAFLLSRLAPHELPAHYAFVDSLPRNELGKVVKDDLQPIFTKEKS